MPLCASQRAATICTAAALVAAMTGCAPLSFLITPIPDAPQLREHVLSRDSVWSEGRVAIVEIEGVISDAVQTSMFGAVSQNPVAVLKEKLDAAARDNRVKALVLRINSPGGGVTASSLMHREVQRFRETTHKPVIACMMDVAASGGYYVACAADRIYAHASTVTGSIGVIMILPDLSGTLSKLGARANVIKSGPMKDAGTPLREMNSDDRALFERLVGEMYESFLDVVAAGRPMIEKPRLRQIADGRVYLGPQAKALGLVDEIGSLSDALDAAWTAAGMRSGSPKVVISYGPRYAYRPNVYASTASDPPQNAAAGERAAAIIHVELPHWLTSGTPQFMYLWSPGW